MSMSPVNPWPGLQTHMRALQNNAASSNAKNSACNGYSPLLFHLFPLDKFVIYSPINITAFPLTYVVYTQQEHAVLLFQVRAPDDLASEAARGMADEELRKKARDLIVGGKVKTEVLHCVSAFGPKCAFYKLNATTGVVEPDRSKALAIERWNNNDVMSLEGARKLKDVVLDIQKMLAAHSTVVR
ncbi:hypothetical protein WG66_011107 [Moniliophthora roreri]|nr:hypothetical protein WG66_011107 [Moniliophthora roreri]